MLPPLSLRDVSRDDVDRVSWWLEDSEISSRWFGHYACGDPIHRGYDPQQMLEATESDWKRVFGDPQRLIYSIYTDSAEHIGEAQLLLDGKEGAELSLLIGRKDLWHHGYGTATVLHLLDRAFDDLRMQKAWVNIPDDNAPARGLFMKLGFNLEDHTQQWKDQCRRPDGTSLRASILSITAEPYLDRQPSTRLHEPQRPVVTITGMPGSQSEAIAREVARALKSRYVDDDQIREALQGRLRCSSGELDAFEASHRSRWTRALASMAMPITGVAGYEMGHWAHTAYASDFDILEDKLTRKQYLAALRSVVRRIAADGPAVMHGHGSHLFVPASADALNVFISATPEYRLGRVQSDYGVSAEEAAKWMKQTDKQTEVVFKNLFDCDLLDMQKYDLTINLDRASTSKAIEIVLGVLGARTAAARQADRAPHPIPEMTSV